MTVRLTVVLGAIALSACADAQDPPLDARAPAVGTTAKTALDPVVVADGRDVDSAEPPAEWTTSPAVQAAVRAARAHWSAVAPGYEEEVRVLAVAPGAFTRPGANEHAVLYLMARWPRCCPKVGLAVVESAPEAGRLVRNVAFEGSTRSARAVPDLDGDGLDEVALLSEFGMGGQVDGSVAVVAFRPAGVAGWQGTSIYQGGCAAGHDGEEAVRLLAVPGRSERATPAFQAERYGRSGCDGGPWTPVGEPAPIDLEAVAEGIYVDLPVE